MKTLVDSASVLVAGMPVGPFAMNQYLVGCKATGAAAIIDAGGAPEPFLDFAAAHGLRVDAIFQTHAHIDHVAGLAATRARVAAPIQGLPID
jgi:glyoxylase-like metal-dependent hydrolase (beta-lactamase superfamily II)